MAVELWPSLQEMRVKNKPHATGLKPTFRGGWVNHLEDTAGNFDC